MNFLRRNKWKRRTEFEPLNKFVVVAMEGAETEPRYFNEFKLSRKDKTQLKLVPNPNHKSNPKEVLQRLAIHFKDYSVSRGDEGWIVIDRDAWPEQDLVTVHREAKDAGFKVAMSNPCFELWLYLHLSDQKPFSDRHDCQKKLAESLPNYAPDNKSKYDASALIKYREKAIQRARKTDTGEQTTWPRNQTTRVYKLVERLLQDSQTPTPTPKKKKKK